MLIGLPTYSGGGAAGYDLGSGGTSALARDWVAPPTQLSHPTPFFYGKGGHGRGWKAAAAGVATDIGW